MAQSQVHDEAHIGSRRYLSHMLVLIKQPRASTGSEAVQQLVERKERAGLPTSMESISLSLESLTSHQRYNIFQNMSVTMAPKS